MQHDDSNDQWGFWDDKPTRRVTRVVASRRHGDTVAQPIVTVRPTMKRGALGSRRGTVTSRVTEGALEGSFDIGATDDTAPSAVRRPIDPLIGRLSAMVLALGLAALAAASFGSNDRAFLQAAAAGAVAVPAESVPSTETSVAVAAVVVDATPVPAAVATPTEPAVTASSVLPEDLPPATPVIVEEITVQAAPAAVAPVERTAAAKPACTKTYPIVAGDFWILIAKKVSVSVADLLAANGATRSTALYAGRSVCLPSHASAPTTVVPPTTVKPPPTTVKAPPTTVKPPPTTVKAPPTTVAAPPPSSYNRAQVEQIIREVWPDDQEDEAVRIATRESNLQPTAKNYCCYGLFQIYFTVHRGWLAGIGVTSASQLFDPRVSATAALTLYQRNGWGPWAL